VVLSLIKESDDLSSNVLPPGLLVIHDASRGGQNDVTKLTRRQEPNHPFLKVGDLDRVTRRDTSGFVDTTVKLDDDLARTVVVNLLELADVAVLLHDAQELDNDLRRRPNQDLPLSSLLGIVDGIQGIVENRRLDHFDYL